MTRRDVNRRRWALGVAVTLMSGTVLATTALQATAQTVVTNEAELRAAFGDASEDHIVLDADIVLADCAAGVVFRDSALDFELDGNGHTVTQTCVAERVFEVVGLGAGIFSNVTISGGQVAGAGGGVFSTDTPITLSNATFIDNLASHAGAVFANGNLIVEDSTFTGNTSTTGVGGALGAVGAMTISGSTFENNSSATDGGALDSDDVTITGSQFVNNSAESGGAVSGNGTMAITASTFTDNQATAGDGGAVRSANTEDLELSGSTFTGNTASGSGGGLYATDQLAATAVFTDVTFTDNHAEGGDGGAIAVDNVTMGVTGSFTGNTAADEGGAIYSPQAVVVHAGSEFIDNGAVLGGALTSGGQVDIRGTTLTGNDAFGSGGAVQANGDVFLAGDAFENNSAGVGGAVWAPLSSVEVASTRMVDNTATAGAGGAVRAAGDVVIRSESELTGNTAVDVGGAVAADGSVSVSDSVLADNAGESGGAISADGQVDVTDSTFTGNVAQVAEGGAIRVTGAWSLAARGSTFADNVAEAGGAMWLLGGDVNLTNSTLTGNSAGTGGAMRVIDGDVVLRHATIVSNEGTNGSNLSLEGTSTLTSFGSVIALPENDNCEVDAGLPTISAGYNASDDATCGLTEATDDETIGDPALAALADNGGPTHTRLPSADSVLVDAIPDADCEATIGADQRGVSRPQGDGCDIGAVEREKAAPPPDDDDPPPPPDDDENPPPGDDDPPPPDDENTPSGDETKPLGGDLPSTGVGFSPLPWLVLAGALIIGGAAVAWRVRRELRHRTTN